MAYFGDTPLGNEITMCFDFIGMQRMYLSLAREDASPSPTALRSGPRRRRTASGPRSCATTTS